MTSRTHPQSMEVYDNASTGALEPQAQGNPTHVTEAARGSRRLAPFRLRRQEPSEWSHHVSLADALRKFKHPDCLCFHIPNQSDAGPRRGFFLRKLGVLAGVADWFFQFRRQVLWLELKRPSGRQSDAQAEFERAARTAGGEYVVSHRLEDSLDLLFARGIITRDLTRQS
jgi:hypothetical protein